MSPRLCYVIPAFNAAGTLADTLRSVIAQRHGAWDALVIDDGSTDRTGDIARSLGHPRVRMIPQANRGLPASRNRGLAESDADAVCFLDADDLVDPEHAGAMLATLDGHDAAACAYRMIGSAGEDLHWVEHPTPADFTPARLAELNPVPPGSVVLRRAALARLGLASDPFDATLPVLEDWDLWRRLTGAGASWGGPTSGTILSYRLRPGSMATNLRLMWSAGLDLIRRDTPAPHPPATADGPLRRWTLRNLARAAAMDDAALAAEMLATLGGPLTGNDCAAIARSLKWAFCYTERVGPGRAVARRDAWRQRAARILGNAFDLRAAFDGGAFTWPAAEGLSQALIRSLGPSEQLVIYGMGRNGRALLDALAALDPARLILWIDDDPACQPPQARAQGSNPRLRRIGPADLSPGHVVVVTPIQRCGILATLAAWRVARVILPDDVSAAGGTPASTLAPLARAC